MVKYFSVDWLAQNHHNAIKEHCADVATVPTRRPHIPCMLQPSPPRHGESYLQTKFRAVKRVEHVVPTEARGPQDAQDSSNRTPPSK